MNKTFYAYIYYDPLREYEPIYVGKGHGNRFNVHIKYSKKKKHPLKQRLNLMESNGAYPKIEIINAIDEGHAFFLEECLIEIFGRKDLGKGPLLNLTDGGEGTSGRKFHHTEETKEKMRLKKIGKPGHKQTSESRKKIAEYQTGRVRDEEFRSKMRGKLKPGTAAALNGKKRSIVECNYCFKVGGEGAMQRWHFNNCRLRSN